LQFIISTHNPRSFSPSVIRPPLRPENQSRYEKSGLGFKQEGGPLRQRIVHGNGTFGDQIIYALLASDTRREDE